MLWIFAHLSAVAVALLIFLAAVLLLQDKRPPQATLAWLLAMVALPYLAVPLFLLVGTRKLGGHGTPPSGPKVTISPGPGPTFRALGGGDVQDGCALSLLDTPDAAFAALIELVSGARKTIEAEFYIVDNDDEGRAFVRALTEKAGQGVEVRLAIDRLGTLHPPRAELDALRQAGGEVRWFTPLLHRMDRGRLNLRNHRKALIADGKTAFSGGMNVGRDYMRRGPDADASAFEDLAFTVRGPVVGDILRTLRADWARAGKTPESRLPAPPRKAGEARLQWMPSGPDQRLDGLHLGLVQAIHRADRVVRIATPYFVPTEALILALQSAALRGLEVQLLVPDRSNHRMTDFARGAYLRELEAAGCTVLRFPRMLHAKVGMIDDMAWVGSANFDVRSLLLNFEAVMMIHDWDTAYKVRQWFRARADMATEGMPKATLLRRMGEGLFRLGAPLM